MAKKKADKVEKNLSVETRNLIGANIGDENEWLKNMGNRANQLEDERKAINDEMGAIRAAVEARGRDKKAFDKARRDAKLDKEARDHFDDSYAICREAFGFPIGHQFDVFTEPAKQAAAH